MIELASVALGADNGEGEGLRVAVLGWLHGERVSRGVADRGSLSGLS